MLAEMPSGLLNVNVRLMLVCGPIRPEFGLPDLAEGKLNVALAYEQVSLGLHERGFVPAVPECAGSPVGVIDVLDVSPAHRDNQSRDRGCLLGGEQQVDVVGHQHVSMEVAMLALQGFAQPAKVGVTVLVVEETGAAIVSTLHDVQRYTVNVDART